MKKYIALVLLVGMGLSSCQVIDKVSNVMSNGLNMPVFDDNNGIGIFVGQNLEHLKECVEHDPEVVTTRQRGRFCLSPRGNHADT